MFKRLMAKLGLGSPVGNPGYSATAPLYNFAERRYRGFGCVWVGKAGGDTHENREAYTAWLRSLTGNQSAKPRFIDRKELERIKLSPDYRHPNIKYNQSMFKYYDVETGELL